MCRKTCFFVMVLTLTVGLSLLAGLVAALAAPPLQGEGQEYTVQKDDNLWTLAEKYLGNGAAYPAIVAGTNAQCERDLSFAKIITPGLIQPGWKLWIPSVEEALALLQVQAEDSKKECEDTEDLTSKTVTCELKEDVTKPVSFKPITVSSTQRLELRVVEQESERTHFFLEIEQGDYPYTDTIFTLNVKATPRQFIADCWRDPEKCKEDYPEVEYVTEDNYLLIPAFDTTLKETKVFTAVNPYAFSVTGIREFADGVTVSISVDKPEEIPRELWEWQDHGIIIHHEDAETTERFPVDLISDDDDGESYRVVNSAPITRCCRCYGHCWPGPMCLKCE